jgi:signal transduction histidine kinase
MSLVDRPVAAGVQRLPGQLPPRSSTASRLAHYWRSLGRPSALSIRVVLWYAPIGAIGPLLLDRPVGQGNFLSWLWVALCGQVVLLACFPLAGLIIHGWPGAADRRERPLATLLAMLAAAILRGLVVAVMAQPLMTTSMISEVSYRLMAAVLFQLGFLVLIALLANDRDDHCTLVADLRDRERQLIELDSTTAHRLATMHRQLVAEVRGAIDPQLSRLLDDLAMKPAGIDAEQRVRQITDFVEEEIRPLSHRLASSSITEVSLSLADRLPARVTTPLPRRLPVVDCLLTWPTAWVIFVAAVVGAMRNAAPGHQFTFIAGMTGTTLLGLLLARRLVRSWTPPTPITLAMVVLLNLALPALALWVMSRQGITGTNAVMAAAAVGAAIGAFSGGYGAVNRGRQLAEQELRAAVARLEASVNLLRQKAWVTRRQLGYVVHGALQGALFAAAMRVSAADEVDARLVESITTDIRNALVRLESESLTGIDVDQALEDLLTLWSGDCQIRWEMDDQCRKALACQAETSTCVAEIIQEAVGNAIRHGGATEVEVSIVKVDQAIGLEVIDNGLRWDPAATPGLGSRMRDEMCLKWSLVREPEHTVLAATLALAIPLGDGPPAREGPSPQDGIR